MEQTITLELYLNERQIDELLNLTQDSDGGETSLEDVVAALESAKKLLTLDKLLV